MFNSKKQEYEHESEIWYLSVINVPCERDIGIEATPFGDSIELMYMENIYQNHCKDYFKRKKGIVSMENYNRIICHVNSLVVNRYVDYVEVSSVNDLNLPIRIDGIDYNDYHCIKINIVKDIKVPLMTFLPIY